MDWPTTAAIATVAATLIAGASLYQIHQQRNAAYKPELYLSNGPLFIYVARDGDRIFPFSYTNKIINPDTDLENDNVKKSLKEFYTIDLVNVGLATAKEVEVEWNFDAKKLADLAQQILATLVTNSLHINISSSPMKNSRHKLYHLTASDGKPIRINFTDKQSKRIFHVRPDNSSNEKLYVPRAC